jgi:hypothetical protein
MKLSSALFFAVPESCKAKSESVNDPFFLRALEGFLLVVSADGDMIFLSENINEYLGITQVCSYYMFLPSFCSFPSQFFHFMQVCQAPCLSVPASSISTTSLLHFSPSICMTSFLTSYRHDLSPPFGRLPFCVMFKIL